MPELLLSFEGRIQRSQFWRGLFVATVVLFVTTLAVGMVCRSLVAITGLHREQHLTSTLLFIFSAPVFGAFGWSFFALLVKRCHDRGKSGWWALIALIPLLSWIWIIIDLGLTPGDAGANMFGPPPDLGEGPI